MVDPTLDFRGVIILLKTVKNSTTWNRAEGRRSNENNAKLNNLGNLLSKKMKTAKN